MKFWTITLFLPILCPPLAAAHFNFFGFGSAATEVPMKASEGAAEAASVNSATVVLPATSSTPAPSQGYTSIFFGTGVTGTQGTPSDGSFGTTLGGTQNAQGMGGGQNVQSMGGAAGGLGPSLWSSGTPGQRAPILPSSPPGAVHQYNHFNNAQTQAKGQGNYHPTPTLPQSNSARVPLHSSHLSSNLATNSLGVSLFNTRNPEPHLIQYNQNQQQTNQAFPASQSQNGNKIQDNRLGGNNDGFGNTGKTSTKTGSFSWMSPEGQVYEVNYVADAIGQKPLLAAKSTFYSPQPPNNSAGQPSPMTSASEMAYSYTPFKPVSHFPDSPAPRSS